MDTNVTAARIRLVIENSGTPQDGEGSRPATAARRSASERSSLSRPSARTSVADRRREDYWAQVQTLRADLASLRLAN